MRRRLLLVRHGETEWNKAGRFQGHIDIPLSDVGRAQARALRERLEVAAHADLYDDAHTAVVTSDLRRAHETAEIAFGRTGRTLHIRRELREFHYGVFEGLTRVEADERYPGVIGGWFQGDRTVALEGGESRAAVHQRSHAAVAAFLAEVPHPNVIVVAHGGVMRQLLSVCFAPDQPFTLAFGNTVVHVAHVESAAWTYSGLL